MVGFEGYIGGKMHPVPENGHLIDEHGKPTCGNCLSGNQKRGIVTNFKSEDWDWYVRDNLKDEACFYCCERIYHGKEVGDFISLDPEEAMPAPDRSVCASMDYTTPTEAVFDFNGDTVGYSNDDTTDDYSGITPLTSKKPFWVK